MKEFKIYQLPVEHNAKFMGLEFVTKHNIMPKLRDYNLVWDGEMKESEDGSVISFLDQVYTITNVAYRPDGFKGHSLSVSDIVEVDGKYFYCDSYGWEEVSFQPKNTITFAPEDVPQEELTGSCTPQHLSELRKKTFDDIKKKHPSAILLFRCGDFYEAYEDDAKKVAEVCGTTLSEDKARVTSFPYHALDTYLPKLIRSGNKVAICDQL